MEIFGAVVLSLPKHIEQNDYGGQVHPAAHTSRSKLSKTSRLPSLYLAARVIMRPMARDLRVMPMA